MTVPPPPAPSDPSDPSAHLSVEFCGELYPVAPGETFEVGRDADLQIDDNPYLHRRFLSVFDADGLWWLSNVGSRLSATVCEPSSGTQSWLPPGARLPLVFAATTVIFTAGPTTYELFLHVASPAYLQGHHETDLVGATTIGAVAFTTSQRQLIVSLAEPMLRREGTGISEIPSSADAAERLGWALTRFNRKLDNVCDKLDKMGVGGLRGGPGAHATNRRSRLVEYAVTSRLVTTTDLPLLDLDRGPA
ncbi:hypothetical protein [Pengzhenrongella phosphoraccumulans]|uniref:hypothetical protein n=1 Tax=Pengzhenrongella phosphoraccumulans TaxID=3114394 RepID=UPI00388F1D7D